MQLSDELTLSYYKAIADINAPHHVWLVQHVDTGKLYVKKQLTVYNLEVFRSLKEHPVSNIPQIYELVEDNGVLTIIEEYVHGESIQALLDEQAQLAKRHAMRNDQGIFSVNRTVPTMTEYYSEDQTVSKEQWHFSEEQALDLTLQLCAIVSELHHRTPPIIHRDIKPSNLILTSDGVLKLLDFNAAKNPSSVQNRDTRLLGTNGYAAPEQYGFGASTMQTDLYAIGVLLNVLLTGKEPYEQHATGSFSDIITKCTMLDPDERYANIDELTAALRDAERRYLSRDYFQEKGASDNNSGYSEEYIHTEQSVLSRKNVHQENPVYTQSTLSSGISESRTNLNQYSQKNVNNKRKFLPPGFRSGSPLHMLIALIGYGLIISCAITPDFESVNAADLLLNQIWFALTGVAVVFFSCNYLDAHARLPLTRSNNKMARILGIILYDILLVLALVLLLVILESILFPQ